MSATIAEGKKFIYQITRNGYVGKLTINTSNGTAGTADYSANIDTYAENINITTYSDNLTEGTEYFNVWVTNAFGSTLMSDTIYISDVKNSGTTGGGSTDNTSTTTNIDMSTYWQGNNVLKGDANTQNLNDTLDGGVGADTMSGGKGDDTYIVDNTGDVVVEAKNQGNDTIKSSVSIKSLSGNVENLVLTGIKSINGTGNKLANVITGNSENNILNGLEGNDTLQGGDGVDTLVGGIGDDIYILDTESDTLTEYSGQGTDTVQSSVTQSVLAAYVENIILTGSKNINATGNDLDNVLIGNSYANILHGGTGIDSMSGGLGNDTYIVDSITDKISELDKQGTDTIKSSVTFSLIDTDGTGSNGGNVENLTLTGTSKVDGTGNILANFIVGNTASNTLYGLDGHDTLDGGGGNDTLIGGSGDDIYLINNSTTTIIEQSFAENSSSGGDVLVSSVDNLKLPDNVEGLALAGSTNLIGKGNSFGNAIWGNEGANVLYGYEGNDIFNDFSNYIFSEGGSTGGADTLVGGLGDDHYTIYDQSQEVIELENEGWDRLNCLILNYTLPENVEYIFMLSYNGTAVGNSLNNEMGGFGNIYLYGLAGNDTLYGDKGDHLHGGDGNDVYEVTSQAEIIETALGGIDTINASISYTLPEFVENLNVVQGKVGIGNELDNTITGNATANTLSGGAGNDTIDGGAGNDILDGGTGNEKLIGGTGRDSLTGGLGSDVFYFETYSELGLAANADVITDFSKAQVDKIDFSLLDAKLGTTVNDSFKFLAVAPTTTSNANGVLWYSNGILYGSNDTDIAAEFQIYVDLTGITTANASTYIVL